MVYEQTFENVQKRLKIYKKSDETFENLVQIFKNVQKLGANIWKLATDFTEYKNRSQEIEDRLIAESFEVWVWLPEISKYKKAGNVRQPFWTFYFIWSLILK